MRLLAEIYNFFCLCEMPSSAFVMQQHFAKEYCYNILVLSLVLQKLLLRNGFEQHCVYKQMNRKKNILAHFYCAGTLGGVFLAESTYVHYSCPFCYCRHIHHSAPFIFITCAQDLLKTRRGGVVASALCCWPQGGVMKYQQRQFDRDGMQECPYTVHCVNVKKPKAFKIKPETPTTACLHPGLAF